MKKYWKVNMDDNKKVVIFGAGATGQRAIRKYGKENIAFFVDNDFSKEGKELEELPICLFDSVKSELKDCHVIIACKAYKTIEKQLIENSIEDYEVYGNDGYYDVPEVVFNPYEYEQDGNKTWIREEINRQVLDFPEDMLFNHVEIETVNRCNGICSFCPVNRNIDPRILKKMDIDVFKKIINELAQMNYDGKIALFSNNEPLIDRRIVELHKYARSKLPNARMHLCTNGTLLSVELFEELMKYLDELIIDNYDKELKLIPNSKKILDYCDEHSELKGKVTITLRYPDEVLTNRGGDAPNGSCTELEKDTSCMLPYKQLIIRPDGKVSLCCNDALGKCTLGDVTTDTLLDIWYGQRFKMVRKQLLHGRKNFPRCKNCDTIFLC